MLEIAALFKILLIENYFVKSLEILRQLYTGHEIMHVFK